MTRSRPRHVLTHEYRLLQSDNANPSDKSITYWYKRHPHDEGGQSISFAKSKESLIWKASARVHLHAHARSLYQRFYDSGRQPTSPAPASAAAAASGATASALAASGAASLLAAESESSGVNSSVESAYLQGRSDASAVGVGLGLFPDPGADSALFQDPPTSTSSDLFQDPRGANLTGTSDESNLDVASSSSHITDIEHLAYNTGLFSDSDNNVNNNNVNSDGNGNNGGSDGEPMDVDEPEQHAGGSIPVLFESLPTSPHRSETAIPILTDDTAIGTTLLPTTSSHSHGRGKQPMKLAQRRSSSAQSAYGKLGSLFQAVPLELWVSGILCQLGAVSICRLAQTCRKMRTICYDTYVWQRLCERTWAMPNYLRLEDFRAMPARRFTPANPFLNYELMSWDQRMPEQFVKQAFCTNLWRLSYVALSALCRVPSVRQNHGLFSRRTAECFPAGKTLRYDSSQGTFQLNPVRDVSRVEYTVFGTGAQLKPWHRREFLGQVPYGIYNLRDYGLKKLVCRRLVGQWRRRGYVLQSDHGLKLNFNARFYPTIRYRLFRQGRRSFLLAQDLYMHSGVFTDIYTMHEIVKLSDAPASPAPSDARVSLAASPDVISLLGDNGDNGEGADAIGRGIQRQLYANAEHGAEGLPNAERNVNDAVVHPAGHPAAAAASPAVSVQDAYSTVEVSSDSQDEGLEDEDVPFIGPHRRPTAHHAPRARRQSQRQRLYWQNAVPQQGQQQQEGQEGQLDSEADHQQQLVDAENQALVQELIPGLIPMRLIHPSNHLVQAANNIPPPAHNRMPPPHGNHGNAPPPLNLAVANPAQSGMSDAQVEGMELAREVSFMYHEILDEIMGEQVLQMQQDGELGPSQPAGENRDSNLESPGPAERRDGGPIIQNPLLQQDQISVNPAADLMTADLVHPRERLVPRPRDRIYDQGHDTASAPSLPIADRAANLDNAQSDLSLAISSGTSDSSLNLRDVNDFEALLPGDSTDDDSSLGDLSNLLLDSDPSLSSISSSIFSAVTDDLSPRPDSTGIGEIEAMITAEAAYDELRLQYAENLARTNRVEAALSVQSSFNLVQHQLSDEDINLNDTLQDQNMLPTAVQPTAMQPTAVQPTSHPADAESAQSDTPATPQQAPPMPATPPQQPPSSRRGNLVRRASNRLAARRATVASEISTAGTAGTDGADVADSQHIPQSSSAVNTRRSRRFRGSCTPQ